MRLITTELKHPDKDNFPSDMEAQFHRDAALAGTSEKKRPRQKPQADE